ncbi:short chain dehydrogenase [Colletotrichum eremochloae]|nr:short chain dehydrogenase [Colletotrichum eremochloae]
MLAIAAIRRLRSLLGLAVFNNFTRDKYDWRRELVVITGGSGDLGNRLVRKLAKNCIKVVSLDIIPPENPLPSNASFYETDITSSTSLEKAAEQIRCDHGEPTVLVNCAAVMKMASILDETEEQIHQVFDVNIISSFLLIKEFLPSMIKHNHGHYVDIAVRDVFAPGMNNVDYACAKSGTLALHEGLMKELRHRYKAPKVRASVVHLPHVKTAMVEKVKGSGSLKSKIVKPEPVVDLIFRQIMSGRSGHVHLPE